MRYLPRCRQRYGQRHQLICRRLAGHKGHHAQRLKDFELEMVLDVKPQRRRKTVNPEVRP